MDFFIVLLGSAVGAALVEGIAAYLVQRKGDESAKASWAREKKYAMYEKHLRESDAWITRVNTDGPKGLIRHSFVEEWMGAYSAIDLALVAPDKVQEAVGTYREDTFQWFSILSGHRQVTPEERKAVATRWRGSYSWMTNIMRSDLGFTDRTYDDRDPEDPELGELHIPRESRQERNDLP